MTVGAGYNQGGGGLFTATTGADQSQKPVGSGKMEGAGGIWDAAAVAAAMKKPLILGVVASRCSVPNAFAAGTYQLMSRSKHQAMDAIASLQLVYSNWYVKSTATVGENNTGGAMTWTAAIEYPAGTIAAVVTFGGATSGTVGDGLDIVSDAVSVSIPAGAFFFVRTWANNTVGIPYHDGSGNLNDVTSATPDSGETWTFGATTADLTQTPGGFNNLSNVLIYRPTAIIGYTSRPVGFIAGDSRQANGTRLDATSDGFGLAGELNRSLGARFATLNAGCSSEKLSDVLTTGYTKRIGLLKYCNFVADGYGINDVVAGRTAAQIKADIATFAARFGALPYYRATLSPKSSSTDSWATTANQTTDGTNSVRTAVNDWIRKCPPPIAGVMEVADAVESARNSGIWKAGYTADGLHGNQTANLAIVAAGGVKVPGSQF